MAEAFTDELSKMAVDPYVSHRASVVDERIMNEARKAKQRELVAKGEKMRKDIVSSAKKLAPLGRHALKTTGQIASAQGALMKNIGEGMVRGKQKADVAAHSKAIKEEAARLRAGRNTTKVSPSSVSLKPMVKQTAKSVKDTASSMADKVRYAITGKN